jgi:hypothetical protein
VSTAADWEVYAGVNAKGALVLTFKCPDCGEQVTAVKSGDGSVPLHILVKQLFIGGIRAGDIVASAQHLDSEHVCDPFANDGIIHVSGEDEP